jgi:hypothetical protein
MPRFYFHVRDGNDLIEDEEGNDLPDLDSALAEAEAAAREIMADRLRQGRPSVSPMIEVRDHTGTRVGEFALPATTN